MEAEGNGFAVADIGFVPDVFQHIERDAGKLRGIRNCGIILRHQVCCVRKNRGILVHIAEIMVAVDQTGIAPVRTLVIIRRCHHKRIHNIPKRIHIGSRFVKRFTHHPVMGRINQFTEDIAVRLVQRARFALILRIQVITGHAVCKLMSDDIHRHGKGIEVDFVTGAECKPAAAGPCIVDLGIAALGTGFICIRICIIDADIHDAVGIVIALSAFCTEEIIGQSQIVAGCRR